MTTTDQDGIIQLTDEELERNVRAFRACIDEDLRRWHAELTRLRAQAPDEQLDLFG